MNSAKKNANGNANNNASKNDASRPISIWRWPTILGIASAVGLLSALIGDDVYDVLSWCLLALPLIMVVRALRSAQ